MKNLSKRITKYFWGDNLKKLSLKKNKEYISKTILEKGDKLALKWLFGHVNKTDLRRTVKNPRMEQKSKNFWNIYFS